MEKDIRLTIVMGVLNQFELTDTTLGLLIDNLAQPHLTQLIVIDNGSDKPFAPTMEHVSKLAKWQVVRNESNRGNYPLFKQGLTYAEGRVVAYLHSDVFVYEKGWDDRVVAQFDANDNLGLVGFIGSTEIDNWGGRGMGTHSNMQGRCVTNGYPHGDHRLIAWAGSKAEIHGKKDAGFVIDGSVVDGCVMIFRTSLFNEIPFKKDLPPHHFYDRIMCCQVIEAGFKVGILGVEFDHVSGQVANTQSKWQTTSADWFKAHYGFETPQEWAEMRKEWVNSPNNPSRGKIPDQWDYCAYLEAEYQFLSEYRDKKHIVPLVMGRPV